TDLLRLCDKIVAIRKAEAFIREQRLKLDSLGRVDANWLQIDSKSVLEGATEVSCLNLIEHLDRLPEWSQFCRPLQECVSQGLAKFSGLVIHGALDPSCLAISYQLTVLECEVEK